MSIQYAYRLMAGFALGLMVIHNSSAESYVSLGVSRLSLNSQNSSIDGGSGTGVMLLYGHELASTWFAEYSFSAATGIETGPTEDIFYPEDTAEYSILRASIRKELWVLSERQWAPWLTAGVAYHYINWDSYFYQLGGTGFSLGAGMDFALETDWRLRVQALRHSFSVSDDYEHGSSSTRSTELSAAVIYALR